MARGRGSAADGPQDARGTKDVAAGDTRTRGAALPAARALPTGAAIDAATL